jgi:hypothetical protein
LLLGWVLSLELYLAALLARLALRGLLLRLVLDSGLWLPLLTAPAERSAWLLLELLGLLPQLLLGLLELLGLLLQLLLGLLELLGLLPQLLLRLLELLGSLIHAALLPRLAALSCLWRLGSFLCTLLDLLRLAALRRLFLRGQLGGLLPLGAELARPFLALRRRGLLLGLWLLGALLGLPLRRSLLALQRLLCRLFDLLGALQPLALAPLRRLLGALFELVGLWDLGLETALVLSSLLRLRPVPLGARTLWWCATPLAWWLVLGLLW